MFLSSSLLGWLPGFHPSPKTAANGWFVWGACVITLSRSESNEGNYEEYLVNQTVDLV